MKRIVKEDYKFVGVDPDPGFDPNHNKQVIEESIRLNDRNRRLKSSDYKERLRSRSEAVAQYLKSIDNGQTSSDVLKYFGRKEIARLRGEEIRESILGKLSDAKIKEARKEAKLPTAVAGRIV